MSIFFQEATMDNESCDKSATDIECRKKSATDTESTDAADTESSKKTTMDDAGVSFLF